MSATVGQELCPLCVEPLDATERSIQFCSCGFSLCRFCWKKLMESDSGRCPNCREAYDEAKVVSLPSLKTDESADDGTSKKKKKKGERKKGIKLSGQERKNLQELRILQRNLVYAVGLSLDICIDSVLAQNEFFGQFGPLKKISVNRSSPYSTGQSRNGPTGAAYVTFVNDEDAARCVNAIDGAVWDGHYIRACFGTTKYCQAFLKGAQCNNPDCLYMHYLVSEGTFTKEEMNSGFSKGKPEFYNLINFDRSKGPVPGSLAKPPKGPGSQGNRKDSQLRGNVSLDLDGSKARPVHEQDWPHLSPKHRSSTDGPKADRSSLEMDRSGLMPKKSTEGSWTANVLKSTASSPAAVPSPLQTQASSQNQKKTVAVLTSPVKVKMVTTGSSRGARSSPMEGPFGHPIAEERIVPKLSAESNYSHASFQSDGQQSFESNIPDLYVPPNAAAESRLRATKSATPLEEEPSRDYNSMEAMIRRRISVPERMIDEAVTKLLPTASASRRGPPPGFNNLHTRASAHDVLERATAAAVNSDRMLQSRMSYEAAAEALKRKTMAESLFNQLAQNMMPPQSSLDLAASLLASQNTPADVGLQNQGFVGSLESPFGGPVTGGVGEQNIGQSNPGYPLSCNSEMQNDLLQSLMSVSSGLSPYNLQGKNSTQLSNRGSVPTMQTRLSADAVERPAIFDFETFQKSQMTHDGNQAQVMNAYLNRQNARDIHGQQASKLAAERAARQQNIAFAQNAAAAAAAAHSATTPSPFNDPAVLAFKKTGEQEIYQMGPAPTNRTHDSLVPLRDQNAMPATPFDDPSGGPAAMWGNGMSMPLTPFLAPSPPPQQQPEMNQASWINATTSADYGPITGTSMGLYTHPVADHMVDAAAGLFYPDKVSSTQI